MTWKTRIRFIGVGILIGFAIYLALIIDISDSTAAMIAGFLSAIIPLGLAVYDGQISNRASLQNITRELRADIRNLAAKLNEVRTAKQVLKDEKVRFAPSVSAEMIFEDPYTDNVEPFLIEQAKDNEVAAVQNYVEVAREFRDYYDTVGTKIPDANLYELIREVRPGFNEHKFTSEFKESYETKDFSRCLNLLNKL